MRGLLKHLSPDSYFGILSEKLFLTHFSSPNLSRTKSFSGPLILKGPTHYFKQIFEIQINLRYIIKEFGLKIRRFNFCFVY